MLSPGIGVKSRPGRRRGDPGGFGSSGCASNESLTNRIAGSIRAIGVTPGTNEATARSETGSPRPRTGLPLSVFASRAAMSLDSRERAPPQNLNQKNVVLSRTDGAGASEIETRRPAPEIIGCFRLLRLSQVIRPRARR
jgi:hypothetical protein